jgi:hypothetical protein
MTQRDTIQTIKAMGMTCRYDRVWQVYIVNYRLGDIRRTADSSYDTNDKDDALDTAKAMLSFGV